MFLVREKRIMKALIFSFVGSHAQIMGCRSYAEFAIRPNMAASPDVVMDFMLTLSNMVRLRADAV